MYLASLLFLFIKYSLKNLTKYAELHKNDYEINKLFRNINV